MINFRNNLFYFWLWASETCLLEAYISREYMGCFKDTKNHELNLEKKEIRHGQTIDLCQDFCSKKNSTYFGLQYGYI